MLKPVRERKTPTLCKGSSQIAKYKPPLCTSHSKIPERPKSASNCCGATNAHVRRPWSSSVYVNRKPCAGKSEKDDPMPIPNLKLGRIPSYIRKKHSTASLEKSSDLVKTEECLEDETPPALVPSEVDYPEKQMQRQRTFNQKEDVNEDIIPVEVKEDSRKVQEVILDTETKQLEDALINLTEEKQMLVAQNQRLKEESESRLEIIQSEIQRNKQLEIAFREMSDEMRRISNEMICTESIEDLRHSRDELKQHVDKLLTENASLMKENEMLRNQQSEDVMDVMEDPTPDQSEIQQKPSFEHLERNLDKYRLARKKLKGVIEKLIAENHRLRESIENHQNEGSFVGNGTGTKDERKIEHSSDEEIANRTDYFQERRKQKRTLQKVIEVKKYGL